jgi:hypothetical protein
MNAEMYRTNRRMTVDMLTDVSARIGRNLTVQHASVKRNRIYGDTVAIFDWDAMQTVFSGTDESARDWMTLTFLHHPASMA